MFSACSERDHIFFMVDQSRLFLALRLPVVDIVRHAFIVRRSRPVECHNLLRRSQKICYITSDIAIHQADRSPTVRTEVLLNAFQKRLTSVSLFARKISSTKLVRIGSGDLFIHSVKLLFQSTQFILFVKQEPCLEIPKASVYHEALIAVEKSREIWIASGTVAYCIAQCLIANQKSRSVQGLDNATDARRKSTYVVSLLQERDILFVENWRVQSIVHLRTNWS